jgi:uncharacterized protein with ATP-grasp and redox domains
MNSVTGISKPILSNQPGSYPWTVLRDRHPALLRQVLDRSPYPPERRAAIERLGREIAGPIEPLTDDGEDAQTWAGWSAGYLGQSWYDVPFLWAENYFYRKLLAAVGYLEPGPWRGIDPFGPFKDAELAGPLVDQELAALDGLAALSAEEKEDALILAALWGNRADLGFLIQAGGVAAPGERVDHLVVDDRPLLRKLLDADGGTVVVVADNAGRELLPDLVLIDHLLTAGRAARVVLHLKPRPYFVSDAMLADLLAALRRMTAAASSEAVAIGRRLESAITEGRLVVRAEPFSVAPLWYRDLPDELLAEFATAKLTIMKGDLNYRRLVGDANWPATTSFAELTSYFPSPVVALRTLKSDVVVGLTPPQLTALDATATAWRTTATYALIQARRP